MLWKEGAVWARCKYLNSCKFDSYLFIIEILSYHSEIKNTGIQLKQVALATVKTSRMAYKADNAQQGARHRRLLGVHPRRSAKVLKMGPAVRRMSSQKKDPWSMKIIKPNFSSSIQMVETLCVK